MEQRLYTVHQMAKAEPRFIDDAFSVFALILPPVWAAWHGLWITLGAVLVLSGMAAMVHPLAVSPVNLGLGLILAFEGGAVARIELGMRGWHEAGVVEAASPEGAEERFLTGHAV